ncbi:MAG: hypothetical protein Q9219_004896 [cf. Caloplaca sp. 3 TL-2023]
MTIKLGSTRRALGGRIYLFASVSSSTACREHRALSSGPAYDYEDFYRYTGGRWLWNEELQLQKHYRKFNVPGLMSIAAKCSGAGKCSNIFKLAEGGSNKVFKLVMDNGSTMIAHVPYLDAGPPFNMTASEVATMDFARTILQLPVPQVISWSAHTDNPVESEYILMEEAQGTQLGEVWDQMEIDNKLKVVEEIIAIERKLVSLSFTRYGNLYFATDSFQGCEKAEILGNVPQLLKDQVRSTFVIGPVVDSAFWEGERARMAIDRGPWKRPQDYLKAIARREIAWLTRYAKSPLESTLPCIETQKSPGAHIALYEKFEKVVDYLLSDNAELMKPVIWHWDLRAPNIFVDSDKVTSLIDWQDIWAGPLFFQARHPGLVYYNGEIMLKRPQHYETITDDVEKARIGTQVEKSIVMRSYEAQTKKLNPVLDEIYQFAHRRTWRDTLYFSTNTWDRDIIPFRQCLILLERHWDDISANTPCPIKFTPEDFETHAREGVGWNETADFWASLDGLVYRDGWTTHEYYKPALEMITSLKEEGSNVLPRDFPR